MDVKQDKKFGNNQHFFPVYIQNFSGNGRLKEMDVNGKKCWLFQGFFSRFTSKIIDVTELTQELNEKWKWK